MIGKTKVWTSEAWGRTDYLKSISFDDAPHNVEVAEKFVRGEFIEESWFPGKVYPKNNSVRLTHVNMIKNGLILVSEPFVDLLRNFQVGSNQVIETELYDHEKRTKQAERFFFLNVTEKKPGCFIPEESKGRFPLSAKNLYLTSSTSYGGVAVKEAAVVGDVDLWMDPILGKTPFFSGPLGDAIKKGKFGRTGLKPCVVLS